MALKVLEITFVDLKCAQMHQCKYHKNNFPVSWVCSTLIQPHQGLIHVLYLAASHCNSETTQNTCALRSINNIQIWEALINWFLYLVMFQQTHWAIITHSLLCKYHIIRLWRQIWGIKKTNMFIVACVLE